MSDNIKQDYCYAYNLDGQLTNVTEASRDKDYFCPCCGAVMIPRMGKIRRWHFAHKVTANCNYETYLHKIAKIRIREAFYSSEKFFIQFDPDHICSIDCPIKISPKCRMSMNKVFNVKQFYDTCEEEVEYGGFRPDLLLRSSLKPDLKPIFIEIYVTHKSSKEKINSSFKIIELPIHCEDDINLIVKSSKIGGNLYKSSEDYMFSDTAAIYRRPFGRQSQENAIFYNFHNEYKISPSPIFNKLLYVLAVNKNGTFKNVKVRCFQSLESLFDKNETLIVSDDAINFFWALSTLYKRNLINKSCMICKYHHQNNICALYKRYGTPQKPKPNDAVSCKYFYSIEMYDKKSNYFPGRINDQSVYKSFVEIIEPVKD